MKFKVTYKGIQQFVGRLAAASRFVEEHWGSVERAYEIGVKLEPVY